MEEKTSKKGNDKNGVFDKERIRKNFTPLKIIVGIIVIVITILIILFFNKDITINKFNNLSTEKYELKESETKQIKLVDYDSANFSMKIPEGWTVETGGTGMFFAIKVYDSKDNRNQIFVLLKATSFIKSNKAHEWWVNYGNLTGNQVASRMFSEAVVLEPTTVENLYKKFNEYGVYAKKFELTYSSFIFPIIDNFTVIEEFESNTAMKSLALEDKTIRATYENLDTGKVAEGLFMASMMSTGTYFVSPGIDTFPNMAYNVIFISSAENEFINYQSILTKSLSTLVYKDNFISTTIKNIEETTDNALKANTTIQSAYNSYNSAWSSRQKSYDITSQKYSDSTLGYERVYDTDTGEIYKAYNGFTDDYKGNKYQTVTDNMYTESISGYIEKAQ